MPQAGRQTAELNLWCQAKPLAPLPLLPRETCSKNQSRLMVMARVQPDPCHVFVCRACWTARSRSNPFFGRKLVTGNRSLYFEIGLMASNFNSFEGQCF